MFQNDGLFGGNIGMIMLLKQLHFKNMKKRILTLRINMILFIMNQWILCLF